MLLFWIAIMLLTLFYMSIIFSITFIVVRKMLKKKNMKDEIKRWKDLH